jgi:hypothetical protein
MRSRTLAHALRGHGTGGRTATNLACPHPGRWTTRRALCKMILRSRPHKLQKLGQMGTVSTGLTEQAKYPSPAGAMNTDQGHFYDTDDRSRICGVSFGLHNAACAWCAPAVQTVQTGRSAADLRGGAVLLIAGSTGSAGTPIHPIGTEFMQARGHRVPIIFILGSCASRHRRRNVDHDHRCRRQGQTGEHTLPPGTT